MLTRETNKAELSNPHLSFVDTFPSVLHSNSAKQHFSCIDVHPSLLAAKERRVGVRTNKPRIKKNEEFECEQTNRK
jgi:hypothetical protein